MHEQSGSSEIVSAPTTVSPVEPFTVDVRFADGAEQGWFWSLDGVSRPEFTAGTVIQSADDPTEGEVWLLVVNQTVDGQVSPPESVSIDIVAATEDDTSQPPSDDPPIDDDPADDTPDDPPDEGPDGDPGDTPDEPSDDDTSDGPTDDDTSDGPADDDTAEDSGIGPTAGPPPDDAGPAAEDDPYRF